jgi:hypothetical protein
VITDPSGEENELNRKLREQFEKLTGTYKGSIIRKGTNTEPPREWKTELGLYIIDVKNGTTPGGEQKFKPALKARFKQLSPVAPNVILDVQYISESNQLFLSVNEAGAPSTPDGLNSISGKLKDNTITGTASKASGLWGDLALQFATKEVEVPSPGDQEDYNRRLTEEYQTVVGNYTGTISPKGIDPFDVIVNIYIYPEATPNGTVPKLKAYYCRADDRFKATELVMTIDYKTEFNPADIELSGQRIVNGSTLYTVTLTGTFQNNEIRGNYLNQTGKEGPFRLKRKKQ